MAPGDRVTPWIDRGEGRAGCGDLQRVAPTSRKMEVVSRNMGRASGGHDGWGDWQAGGMEPDGLFDLDEAPTAAPPVDPPSADRPAAPLAVRMRPRTVDEVVGQEHLLRPGAPLRRLVEGGTAASDRKSVV